MDRWLTVNSLCFDLAVRRSWNCRLIEHRDGNIVLKGVFDVDVEHPHLGKISAGTVSHEYFWSDRWYNVFRFHRPDGSFLMYYCNVGMPPVLTDNVLYYIDLDIDVMIRNDGEAIVLDRDEFELNSTRYGYPTDVRKRALKAVDELLLLARRGEFPFDAGYLTQPIGY